MRILVIGTGNIGTLYGWALADAGHRVSHLLRAGGVAGRPAIARLDLLDERPGRPDRITVEYAWDLTEAVPSEPVDVVLMATPADRVEPTVAELAPRLPGATFAIWSLAWDPIPGLDRLLPADRRVLGYPDSGGTRDEAGEYVLALGAEPHVGPHAGADGSSSVGVAIVADLLRSAGLTPGIHDPFEPWLCVHCALTVPYWAALARDRDTKAMLRDGRLLRRAFRASHEALRLCEVRGVDLGEHPEVDSVKLPAVLFPFAFRILFQTNESMRRVTAHGVAGLEEGRILYSQMLRTADELGLELPELRAVGAAWTPARAAGGLPGDPASILSR